MRHRSACCRRSAACSTPCSSRNRGEPTAMTRIATASQISLMQYYMMQNQSGLNTLNAQISTGYTAQTYAEIAPQATDLVNLQAEVSSQQGYVGTINTLSTRLQAMTL